MFTLLYVTVQYINLVSADGEINCTVHQGPLFIEYCWLKVYSTSEVTQTSTDLWLGCFEFAN